MLKQGIARILETEMDRKDFLKFVGLGLVAATGATQVVRTLAEQPQRQTAPAAASHGYGGSAYGGIK